MKRSNKVGKALRAYKSISQICKNPIIYGSLAYNIVTKQNTKINDLDILVYKKDLRMLAQRIRGAVHHKKYDTVHTKIAGIKVELDARERWGPKRLTTINTLYKKTKVRTVSKKTLIWFYTRGKKKAHKQKLTVLKQMPLNSSK